MLRTTSMINLMNDDDWRSTGYTDPGLNRRRGRYNRSPENLYSISKISPPEEKNIIFSHFNLSRRIWEYIILFVSVLPLFEVPFVAIYLPHLKFYYYFIMFIFDVLFGMDLYVATHTSYLSHGVFITQKEKVFRHYGRWNFIFHLIAIPPLGWIGLIVDKWYVFVILSINKFFRLMRAMNAVDTIRRSLIYANWAASMIPLFLLLAFFIHFFATMFYTCAKLEGISESWIATLGWDYLSPPQLYVVSIYFVMTTILTIGYGDVTPKTSPETILVIFIQLIGVMINAYIISTLVSILIDPIGNEFLTKFQGLVEFLRFKKVPKQLSLEIKDYFQLKWNSYHGTEDPENVYKFIPETIRDKLKRDLCSKVFSKVSYFKMGTERLFVAISDLLRDVSYCPGDIISRQNEVTQELLLLNNGIIEISVDNQVIAKTKCDDGFPIGEQDLFIDTQKTANVKALTYVEGWVIKRSDMLHYLAHRPDIRKDLLDNAMMVYPAKYKEIKKLLSGRNMKAELIKKKEMQQMLIKRILEINKNDETPHSASSSSDDEIDISSL